MNTLPRTINGATLQPGQRWHREDWNQEMLSEKDSRPLIEGENALVGDDYLFNGAWEAVRVASTFGLITTRYSPHVRTTRPLPKVETSEREEFEQIQAKLNRGHLLYRRPENQDHYGHAGTEFCWLTFKAAREAKP